MGAVAVSTRGVSEWHADPTADPSAELERRVRARTAELEAANRKLLRAREEAERASRRKTEFLSQVSHELRTSLNAVLGLAQLLERRPLPPRESDLAREIGLGGRQLLRLVNDLLEISRIESGRPLLSIEPVSAGKVIRGAADLMEPLATEHRVQLCVEFPEPVPPLLADRQRVEQILLNLLSNAVKFNHERGRVTISCVLDSNGRDAIHVTDTGPGIAPQDLERAFEPFERLGADAMEVEGTGLGLTVAKGLAEAMGGALVARSRPGRGSTFSLLLPVAVGAPANDGFVGPLGEPLCRIGSP